MPQYMDQFQHDTHFKPTIQVLIQASDWEDYGQVVFPMVMDPVWQSTAVYHDYTCHEPKYTDHSLSFPDGNLFERRNKQLPTPSIKVLLWHQIWDTTVPVADLGTTFVVETDAPSLWREGCHVEQWAAHYERAWLSISSRAGLLLVGGAEGAVLEGGTFDVEAEWSCWSPTLRQPIPAVRGPGSVVTPDPRREQVFTDAASSAMSSMLLALAIAVSDVPSCSALCSGRRTHVGTCHRPWPDAVVYAAPRADTGILTNTESHDTHLYAVGARFQPAAKRTPNEDNPSLIGTKLAASQASHGGEGLAAI
ncbi:hypothetical protein P154DRAFT_574851 [Amniculicola lignicola CBS 123094]|uniref:Uncharacterized protein n=1 Tax=Amniculicola lignicola CBS 123094 TaxID=1392246 RepID=A0A6A5WKQ1_9PLEO|nr:hypothetical protein P154DRAFT_574851 [Amniculicola lignicola CBS 123094]